MLLRSLNVNNEDLILIKKIPKDYLQCHFFLFASMDSFFLPPL